MFNYFIFDGHDSRDYGVYISGGGTFNSPARLYENISVPGRDGDLLGASTRLQNVTLTYPAGVVSDFAANIEGLRNMLLSTVGYAVLYDSYHPDEYRYAVYKGGLEQDPLSNLQAGEFEITFECKPQRYLFSGGEARDLGTWGEVTELTGDIVTFEGAADTDIKSLTVQIEPSQSGSGDPSPSNIRPITGWTGATVTRCGKNLLKPVVYVGVAYNPNIGATFSTTLHSTQFTDNHNGTFSVSTSSTWRNFCLLFPVKSGVNYWGQYAFSSTGQGGVTRGYLDNEYKVLDKINSTDATQTFRAQLSNPEDAAYYYIVLTNRGTASATLTLTEPIIYIGTSATTYEAYTGTTYPITWQTEAGTVYGGTVDVTSGVLTVTAEKLTLNGSEGYWSGVATTNGVLRAYTDLSFQNRELLMCDSLKIWTNNTTLNIIRIDSGQLVVTPQWAQSAANINDFKTLLASNNINIVRTLTTPQTYQLTPQQVDSLLGQNNIWADAGPITLEYGKDPGKLANPTLFDARPVFRVFGYGALNVGNQVVTIAQNPLDYIDIDSALMDCYCGATNANQYVTFSGNDFPVLPPGVTSITFSNTITQVLVTTNWWRV